MLFPRTIFADRNSIYRQWWHLFSEVIEVGCAIIKKDWNHVARELVDVQQSADTALHIVMDQHGADSYRAYTDVAVSCTRRGYYKRPFEMGKGRERR